ncbi:hypothetical protein [Actinoplanes sp. NPDC051851]|uniref:hypothetical protein n=1 Tax=Actinoplanes sp. NPDC051851 TaxID=3154753 RepID=UPI00342E73BA
MTRRVNRVRVWGWLATPRRVHLPIATAVPRTVTTKQMPGYNAAVPVPRARGAAGYQYWKNTVAPLDRFLHRFPGALTSHRSAFAVATDVNSAGFPIRGRYRGSVCGYTRRRGLTPEN